MYDRYLMPSLVLVSITVITHLISSHPISSHLGLDAKSVVVIKDLKTKGVKDRLRHGVLEFIYFSSAGRKGPPSIHPFIHPTKHHYGGLVDKTTTKS